MNKTYTKHFNTRSTPQTQPIPGTNQTRNEAGGYTWAVDKWVRLDRFLMMGTEGGTYYIGEKKLTVEMAQNVLACIKEDGARVVNRVVEISVAGRAPKNDPALFVLALCAGLGDVTTRQQALDKLSQVARIGTHLFQFVEFVTSFRGWGRALKRGISNWYSGKDVKSLVYQLVKYQRRGDWSHSDILRHIKVKPSTQARSIAYRWAIDGLSSPHNKDLPRTIADAATLIMLMESDEDGSVSSEYGLELIWAFEKAKQLRGEELNKHILAHNLTHEMVPTEAQADPETWKALLPSMPLMALLRNLGRMTSNGSLKPFSDEAGTVINRFKDERFVKRARLHPLAVVEAQRVYKSGRGIKGSSSWTPVQPIVSALDVAVEHSFQSVEPTGKRILVGIDVSGSMSTQVNGMNAPMSCSEAATVLALAIARSEPQCMVIGFNQGFVNLDLSPQDRLSTATDAVLRQTGGGTDCSIPIRWAAETGLIVDAFVILTDHQTWAGPVHPVQALREYRARFNSKAKLIAIAMAPYIHEITDPGDGGCLAIAGLDTSAPAVISSFISG